VGGLGVLRAVTLTNPSPINIPFSGTASLYPSIITVSNLSGEITRVTVTLSNASHSFPDDLDILLAGPHGQNVLVMSDAGGSNGLGNVTLTFSDGFGPHLQIRGRLPAATTILRITAPETSCLHLPRLRLMGRPFRFQQDRPERNVAPLRL
jgi:hypothetical protein